MELQLHGEYVYTRQLSLDLSEQQRAANLMYDYIKKDISGRDYTGQSSMIDKVFTEYSYFLYAVPGISNLLREVRQTFHACNNHRHGGIPPYDDYYIQCWLNRYNKGDYIDWHAHWPPEYDAWHGFYCVDVEPESSTTYKVDDNFIEVPSKNNLLVLSKSENDVHRSSEWMYEDHPRITLAFDIVPTKLLFEKNLSFKIKNHWMPLC
jgi:hypothetical protein